MVLRIPFDALFGNHAHLSVCLRCVPGRCFSSTAAYKSSKVFTVAITYRHKSNFQAQKLILE